MYMLSISFTTNLGCFRIYKTVPYNQPTQSNQVFQEHCPVLGENLQFSQETRENRRVGNLILKENPEKITVTCKMPIIWWENEENDLIL